MVQNHKVYERILTRYDGLFDLDGLYAAVIDWAKENGYMWHEADYKHKPKGEIEWKWAMEKNVTEYIRYKYNFKIHMWDSAEVKVEGRSKPMSKGRIYIYLTPSIDSDWQNKYSSGGRFAQWLGKQYLGIIFFKKMSDHYDIVWYNAYKLQAIMRKFFNMQAKANEFHGYLGDS
jgi:hypothetical protein